MERPLIGELLAFIAVAKEKSFTRAAAQLGVSQSALSHTIRALEERLALRLLARTTRSVTPTEAGERLLQSVAPKIADIEAEIAALGTLRDKPQGTVRITTGEHVAESILVPALTALQQDYPDIRIELVVDYGLTDIVAERFDAGVRVGEQVAKDMIAVPIGPSMRMAVVGSPQYFKRCKLPKRPQDLVSHNCIGLRNPGHGGIYPWEFEKRGRAIKIKVSGNWSVNTLALRVSGALHGAGLAYVPEESVAHDIEQGRLVRVLEDWCAEFPGYHLYYASRKLQSPVFALVVAALRNRLDQRS